MVGLHLFNWFFAMIYPLSKGDLMDWQGIPFRLLDGEMIDRLSVALNAIPKIQVETPVDYTAALATVTATLIAGLIPAGLSWWLFRRNAENTKKEREQQQLFLKTERAEQQAFLKNERESQIKSLEEDRRVQLEISKQNFNMQVLSANRQAWVNELRDRVAEVIALAPILQQSVIDVIASQEHSENLDLIETDVKDVDKNEVIYTNKIEAFKEFQISREKYNNYNKEMELLHAKIVLMLNPSEEESIYITTAVKEIIFSCVSIDKADVDLCSAKRRELFIGVSDLTKYTQACLKTEWERVKKGQ